MILSQVINRYLVSSILTASLTLTALYETEVRLVSDNITGDIVPYSHAGVQRDGNFKIKQVED